jgi:hypothetical protein
MTTGQEALIEAMRLEQGRIYGQLQREHREPKPAREQPAAPVIDIKTRRTA